MKTVRIGKNHREMDVPTSWAEAERMITDALLAHGRGRNLEIQGVCARIAYGLLCHQDLTADPTDALAYLIQRICKRKGADLEP